MLVREQQQIEKALSPEQLERAVIHDACRRFTELLRDSTVWGEQLNDVETKLRHPQNPEIAVIGGSIPESVMEFLRSIKRGSFNSECMPNVLLVHSDDEYVQQFGEPREAEVANRMGESGFATVREPIEVDPESQAAAFLPFAIKTNNFLVQIQKLLQKDGVLMTVDLPGDWKEVARLVGLKQVHTEALKRKIQGKQTELSVFIKTEERPIDEIKDLIHGVDFPINQVFQTLISNFEAWTELGDEAEFQKQMRPNNLARIRGAVDALGDAISTVEAGLIPLRDCPVAEVKALFAPVAASFEIYKGIPEDIIAIVDLLDQTIDKDFNEGDPELATIAEMYTQLNKNHQAIIPYITTIGTSPVYSAYRAITEEKDRR